MEAVPGERCGNAWLLLCACELGRAGWWTHRRTSDLREGVLGRPEAARAQEYDDHMTAREQKVAQRAGSVVDARARSEDSSRLRHERHFARPYCTGVLACALDSLQ